MPTTATQPKPRGLTGGKRSELTKKMVALKIGESIFVSEAEHTLQQLRVRCCNTRGMRELPGKLRAVKAEGGTRIEVIEERAA